MRTLFIAGDSTAAQKYADAAPETGWGMALPFFLHKDVTVANHAINGRSTKSFLDEGRLDAILEVIRPGDLLLIQFAHNDQKDTDPTRYTEPWSTYQDNLRRYVSEARERGALPVLATSVERRKFDADGRALRTLGDYPAAMRRSPGTTVSTSSTSRSCPWLCGRSSARRRPRRTSTGRPPSRTTPISTRRGPSPWRD